MRRIHQNGGQTLNQIRRRCPSARLTKYSAPLRWQSGEEVAMWSANIFSDFSHAARLRSSIWNSPFESSSRH